MQATTIKKQQPFPGAIAKNASTARYNHTTVLIICFISVMFGGIASMLMPVYLTTAVKDLSGNITNGKMNNISAYINSIFILGSMSGAFAWKFICHKTGRSKAVILSTAVYGLFTILTAFSSSWIMVGVYRFATGFGVGGIILTTNILVAELWPEKNRAIAIGIISSAMPAGFIAAGAMNNLFADWHYAFLTGVIPVITAIVGALTLSASWNWKNNKQTSSDSSILSNKLFVPSYKKDLIKGPVIFGAMLIGLWVVFSWAPAWIESITGNDARVSNPHGLTMMILATSGLGGSIISGWIVNAIGLRKTMMLCFAVSFIMPFMVFKLNTSVAAATFTEMGLLAFFFGVSQGGLSVYISSSFPVVTRATGSHFNTCRLFTATIIFFTGALVSFLDGYGNAVFIFSFIFLTALAASYFTKYKPASRAVTLNTAFAE